MMDNKPVSGFKYIFAALVLTLTCVAGVVSMSLICVEPLTSAQREALTLLSYGYYFGLAALASLLGMTEVSRRILSLGRGQNAGNSK
jgi:hypothetical protein